MEELSRSTRMFYALAVMVVVVVGLLYLRGGAEASSTTSVGTDGTAGQFSEPGEAPSGATPSDSGRRDSGVVVYVTGAVRRPGVVELGSGARIGDALKAAGGAKPGANLLAVNLAMRVADGQQITVPLTNGRGADSAGGQLGGADGSAVRPGGAATPGPVSLNAATVEQLDTLDGLGPGLAAKIIAERERRGGFRSVEELATVPGIGDKRLESLRAQLQP